ncbi:MAG: oligopeptide/dipeptide ABC transporter ATP-binding protein [Calditrichota bacterium]
MKANARANGALLQVEGLQKYFPLRQGFFSRIRGWVRAVDGVTLEVQRGRTLGLVGESGCGKTTAGRTIIRLWEPSAGQITFDGLNVRSLKGEEFRALRRRMQIVFQDPYSSLNPRITVGGMLTEIIKFHKLVPPRQIRDRVGQILDSVGLSPVYAGRYPHEFSGGQRQRIGIARALSVDPEFIVLDEPVSALDVSIQAQILNLLKDLQDKLNLTYLFISHDLSVVEHISDDIAVMYLGRVVEIGPAAQIVNDPRHPYSRALLAAVPRPDPDQRRDFKPLLGDVPSPANPPSGCHFHPRCPAARPECAAWAYKLLPIEDNRRVACILFEASSN